MLSPAAATSLRGIAAVAQELRLQGCEESMVLLALSQLRLQECQLACAQVSCDFCGVTLAQLDALSDAA